MSQRYLVAIGREPELSIAELESLFLPHGTVEALTPEVVLVQTTRVLEPTFLDRLGGAIKLATVVEDFVGRDPFGELAPWLTSASFAELLQPEARDIGFSMYGATQRMKSRFTALTFETKKALQAAGRRVRIVTSREPTLSAVTVHRQGLLKHGHEFLIVVANERCYVGRTIAVQDYQSYSVRDYGRPAADPRRGMIPPKLAQMMLNIARVTPEDVIADPFCGVGTILQEAALMGVRELHGSDIDLEAIKAAQENMRWLVKEYPQLHLNVEITRRDARQMNARPTVIVTEPDLGRPLRGHEPRSFLQHEAQRLEQLYAEAFTAWSRAMPVGGRVVMVWPQMVVGDEVVDIDLRRHVDQCGFVQQSLISQPNATQFRVHDRSVLTYAREQAKVRRCIRWWVKMRSVTI